MNKYVVFDGMDGSGKGTQLELLKQLLGTSAVFTREPGGTLFAEKIRELVRDNPLAGKSTPLNNFMLFWAAREELQHTLVGPALRQGRTVFSDRGDSSTFAFQIQGEKNYNLLTMFEMMRGFVFNPGRGRREPDLYIVFDLPADEARRRAIQDANRTRTHFDVRDVEYYRRVHYGFHRFARSYPQTVLVNAARSRQEVHRAVLKVLIENSVISSKFAPAFA